MFGLTAGAVWVYLRRERFTGRTLSPDLAYYSGAFAIAMAAGLIVELNLRYLAIGSADTIVMVYSGLSWILAAAALALPFFFSGVVVSLALTRSPFPIGRVYGVDLAGAAAGCLGALLLLNLTDGASALLWTCATAALGGWFFSICRVGDEAPEPAPFNAILGRPHWVALALAVLASFNSATEFGIHPQYIKGHVVRDMPTPLFEKWNSFSRVAQYDITPTRPHMWGPSPRFPAQDWPIEQRWLNIDGDAATTSYHIAGDVEKAGFLRYDVTNLAYFLPERRRAAVIGVGGGRDMLSARVFGVEQITGVEINPIIMGLLTEEPGFADYTGIADLDGMTFEVDEARSWFARSKESFDVIQMSLIDTWAATGAGAYTLSENGLYTLEAWQIFLRHLTPDGVFTVSRWYGSGEINETGRMVSLAMAAIMELGTSQPRQHVFLAASGRIATLVLSRSPLSPAYVETLLQTAEEMDYQILISPDRASPSAILNAIVESRSLDEINRVTSDLKLDLTPPTDERPFFFNQLPLHNLSMLFGVTLPGLKQGVARGNLQATLTLVLLIVVSLLLVIKTVVTPLRPAIADVGRRLAFGGTAYFFLIGAGFMFAEIALLQRMSVFLGHPIYSLSIVLFSMILSTGLGSMLSDRFVLHSLPRLIAWSLATGCYLFSLTVWLPPVLLSVESEPLLVRAGMAVAVIAPAGFLLGFGFPTGIRLINAVDPKPTPWFWGINGAAGVLASSLAVLCSMAYGISASLIFATLCYWLLVPAGVVVGFAGLRDTSRVAPA